MELIANIIQQALETVSNPEQVTEMLITPTLNPHFWFVDMNGHEDIFVEVSYLKNYGFTSTVHEYPDYPDFEVEIE